MVPVSSTVTFTPSSAMQVANDNLKLRELLAKQLRVKALEEKGKLQEELVRMQ